VIYIIYVTIYFSLKMITADCLRQKKLKPCRVVSWSVAFEEQVGRNFEHESGRTWRKKSLRLSPQREPSGLDIRSPGRLRIKWYEYHEERWSRSVTFETRLSIVSNWAGGPRLTSHSTCTSQHVQNSSRQGPSPLTGTERTWDQPMPQMASPSDDKCGGSSSFVIFCVTQRTKYRPSPKIWLYSTRSPLRMPTTPDGQGISVDIETMDQIQSGTHTALHKKTVRKKGLIFDFHRLA